MISRIFSSEYGKSLQTHVALHGTLMYCLKVVFTRYKKKKFDCISLPEHHDSLKKVHFYKRYTFIVM